MNNKNISKILNCYAGPTYAQEFPKYIDSFSICPFSWNHGSCRDYDLRIIWTPELLYEKMRSNSQFQ